MTALPVEYIHMGSLSIPILLQWHLFLRELLFCVDNYQQQSSVMFNPTYGSTKIMLQPASKARSSSSSNVSCAFSLSYTSRMMAILEGSNSLYFFHSSSFFSNFLDHSSSKFCNFRLHSSSRFSSRFTSFWLSTYERNI